MDAEGLPGNARNGKTSVRAVLEEGQVLDHPRFTRLSGTSHRVLSDGGKTLTVALDGDHDGLGRPEALHRR